MAKHGLLLNSAYFSEHQEVWDGAAIRKRAQWLVERTNEIWPMLGELQESPGRKEKPKALTILGESYDVKSWRDVIHSTAECIVQWRSSDFESVAEELPTYIQREPFEGRHRPLSNGWYLYVNLSAESVKRICQNMLEVADIPDEEFELEIW